MAIDSGVQPNRAYRGQDGNIYLNGAQLVTDVSAIADLDQTIEDPPTQAEVQAISDKIDELLAALRGAGLIATS